jgi:hypothetical protein
MNKAAIFTIIIVLYIHGLTFVMVSLAMTTTVVGVPAIGVVMDADGAAMDVDVAGDITAMVIDMVTNIMVATTVEAADTAMVADIAAKPKA